MAAALAFADKRTCSESAIDQSEEQLSKRIAVQIARCPGLKLCRAGRQRRADPGRHEVEAARRRDVQALRAAGDLLLRGSTSFSLFAVLTVQNPYPRQVCKVQCSLRCHMHERRGCSCVQLLLANPFQPICLCNSGGTRRRTCACRRAWTSPTPSAPTCPGPPSAAPSTWTPTC